MEKFQLYRENAAKKLKFAEHSLRFTFPVVQDARLLLGVNENLLQALQNLVFSAVAYERLFRRVPPYIETFESQYKIFKEKVAARYNIDEKYIKMIERVLEISKKHKDSPVEFSKNSKFVICSGSYNIDALSVKEFEGLVSDAGMFFKIVNSIVSKNEHLFSE
jgi:hypothetical protein